MSRYIMTHNPSARLSAYPYPPMQINKTADKKQRPPALPTYIALPILCSFIPILSRNLIGPWDAALTAWSWSHSATYP